MKTTSQLKTELEIIKAKLKDIVVPSVEHSKVLADLSRLIDLLYLHEDFYRTQEELEFLRTIVDANSPISAKRRMIELSNRRNELKIKLNTKKKE